MNRSIALAGLVLLSACAPHVPTITRAEAAEFCASAWSVLDSQRDTNENVRQTLLLVPDNPERASVIAANVAAVASHTKADKALQRVCARSAQ